MKKIQNIQIIFKIADMISPCFIDHPRIACLKLVGLYIQWKKSKTFRFFFLKNGADLLYRLPSESGGSWTRPFLHRRGRELARIVLLPEHLLFLLIHLLLPAETPAAQDGAKDQSDDGAQRANDDQDGQSSLLHSCKQQNNNKNMYRMMIKMS